MSNSTTERQSFVAGTFVLSGIALAVATLVVIEQLSLASRIPYRILFTVEDGVSGLATGSDVQVGGLSRGKVTTVTPQFESTGADAGRMTGVEVAFELDESVELFTDAIVLRMSPLLGTTAFLNFTSLGGGPDATRVAPDGSIDAQPSPGMLATIVGGRNAAAVGEMISSVEHLSSVLGEEFPQDYDEFIRPSLRDLHTVMSDVRSSWPGWSEKVTTTLDNTSTASKDLVAGIGEARELVAKAEDPVDRLGTIVRESEPTVTEALANALEISERVNALATKLEDDAMPRVLALLESGKRILDGASASLDRIEPELLRQLPQVRAIVSDIREASAELKLSMIEVRRNPWRLLFRPSSEIVGNENLFAAARNFAIAAGDLRMAGEAMEEVLAADPTALADDPDLAGSLRDALRIQFERYEQAQQDLFRIILAEPDGD